MSQDVGRPISGLLADVDGARCERKGERRVRIDATPENLPAVLELLKGRAGYLHLSAITCVDWIDDNEFELIYHLWSYEDRNLVSAHIRIPREPGVYLSVYDLFEPAGFFERDIHEMYGVFFEGSPDQEKFILTEWNGPPPMRKDFDAEGWVQGTFQWEDYRPDWLQEIEADGGGVAIRPEQARANTKKIRGWKQ
ncbi:MAG: NADH-quinone oxidoreductase subunit C [Chromatiales bacterium]|nr:NADH-quinone oxidoreductase subunit C [Chromatiales bacterium]